jgi:hypothetical protein
VGGLSTVPRTSSTAPTRQARIAGLLYLLVIFGGLFAELFVRGSLTVPGDAAATARAIADSELLWRWGIAVHLLYLVAAVVVAVLLYGIFRPVQRTLAGLALVFDLVSVTIEAYNLLHLWVPVATVEESGAITALDESQQQALAYLAVRLFATGWSFALLMFAGFCVLVGVLIVRSRLIPRVIGALMIAAGACYFVNSLALILSAALSRALVPWILLPSFLGELSLAVWLAAKGVTVTPAEARYAIRPSEVRADLTPE